MPSGPRLPPPPPLLSFLFYFRSLFLSFLRVYSPSKRTVGEQDALVESKKGLKTNDDQNNHKSDRSYRKRDVDEDIKIIDSEKDGSGKDRESNRGRDRDGERSSRDNLKLSIPGRTSDTLRFKDNKEMGEAEVDPENYFCLPGMTIKVDASVKLSSVYIISLVTTDAFINTDFTGLKNIYGYAQVVDSNASADAAIPKYNGVAKLYFEEVDTEYPLRGGESERHVYEFFSKVGKADDVFALYSVGGASKNSWTCVCEADGLPKVAADRPNSTCFSAYKCTTSSSMKGRR
ncbi:hypothetical protein ACFE04_001625 [Oxalis oulophora]